MEIFCTRPGCKNPRNYFSDLDDISNLKTAQQKYCTSCGMPLILGGRYLTSRLLGKGGFGAAFLARDRYTPTMRQCVVKLFQPVGNLSPQELEIAQQLFEREAEVLEELGNEHSQIPNLYAFFPGGDKQQFFYLVQEYIDGQNLEEELKQKGKLSETEVLEVLTQILKILQFVHEHDSIHRDIKPSNIMRDGKERLYLLDFGAVKQVTSAGNTPGKSTGIYSLGFAPPEQMAGSQIYPSTDLYALGATCLNLLTGKEPEEMFDSYNDVWHWKTYAPQVTEHTAKILDKMLQRTPKERFQSAQEVLTALQPTQTTPSPPPPPPINPAPKPAASTSPPIGAPQPRNPPFKLTEVLIAAGFSGFEGSLLFIAAKSLPISTGISIGVWGMVMGGLIYAQSRRIIENWDPWILAAITLLAILFFSPLRDNLESMDVVFIACLAGAAAVAVTAMFRLIYQLLARIL